jgi:hypothetical protein
LQIATTAKDQPMRIVLAAAIACAALFFAVPIVAGGSTDVCQDVALSDVQATGPAPRVSTSNTMYNVMDPAASLGSLGNETHDRIAKLHPHIPPAVSCAAVFWKSL